jgi:hypothetical protein
MDDARAAPISVLLLGDTRDQEMAPIADSVISLADETRVADDIERGCELIRTGNWHPDLIVVLQTWSDQFSPADVLQLLSLAPLARMVCAAGAWCDSDSRTRTSWPLAVRIRAVDALGRIEREIALLRSAAKGSGAADSVRQSALPLTASRAEVFAADLAEDPMTAPGIAGGLVQSPDRAWKEMIEQALGISQPHNTEDGAPAVVVFDADPWSTSRRKALQAAHAHWPGTLVIACSGITAVDLSEELKSAGADAVWFKLSPLASLRRFLAPTV